MWQQLLCVLLCQPSVMLKNGKWSTGICIPLTVISRMTYYKIDSVV